jgi:tRNA A-37 threonylcarbamoyl transferase component Bud32
MFIKEVDEEIGELEVELQTIATRHGFAPMIWDTEIVNGKIIITMDHLGSENLDDTYGEEIPEEVWDEIRRIVRTLYEEEGIEYIDITPYNFIEKDGKIYVIDFGDAKYTDGEPNWFLNEFLDGENSWNPDYK